MSDDKEFGFDALSNDDYMNVDLMAVTESESITENAETRDSERSTDKDAQVHDARPTGDKGVQPDTENLTQDVQPSKDVQSSQPSDSDAGIREEENDSDSSSGVYSISEYQKILQAENKCYGLTKMRYSKPAMSFVRPRVRVPGKGKPVVFVCEGVQLQTSGSDKRLLCPGRILSLPDPDAFQYVVIGCIWVSV